ncbi:hypothetical protein MIMGU_mgv1a014342mg [Erythranthe guttata]|uniref:Uncharacterized protein n=1 Tax=Erythranthe guttata TaxID=4155 RepID=A0A022QNN8_ERYGU|nr:hypothetical protein MIMGU_mgv1a014342mg [Erythranthe guttata]
MHHQCGTVQSATEGNSTLPQSKITVFDPGRNHPSFFFPCISPSLLQETSANLDLQFLCNWIRSSNIFTNAVTQADIFGRLHARSNSGSSREQLHITREQLHVTSEQLHDSRGLRSSTNSVSRVYIPGTCILCPQRVPVQDLRRVRLIQILWTRGQHNTEPLIGPCTHSHNTGICRSLCTLAPISVFYFSLMLD